MLHNLGESDIVRLNISAVAPIQNPKAWLAAETLKLSTQPPAEPQNPTAKPSDADSAIVGRVQRVGQKAHGLVPWQGAYILLDSESGALMALDLTGAAAGKGFNLHKLWQAPEPGVFLKGLAVVDDIAYFGISPWAPRSARDDPQSNNELAAFDLISGNLLWRRQVPTAGLLNIIGAPHLSIGSTYVPSYTGRPETDAVRKHHSSPEVAAAMASLTEIGYPPKIGGYWSSGLPFLDADTKGTSKPWEAGLQLPLLMLNISKLQAAVASLPAEAWTYDYQARYSAVMAGREGNQNAFKPGVEGIVLLFSANDGSGPVYEFPAYGYFKDTLEPLLQEILGKRDMQHIIRLQLALMKPGVSDIKIHVDSGGYAIRGHRLHIPVFTHPEVSFDVCPHRYVPDPAHVPAPGEQQRMLDIQECFKIPTVEGFAFELNNRAAHKVSNLSPVARVHVVLDLCEEPHPRITVPPGTICDYDMEKGLLCKYPEGESPVVMAPAAYLDAAAAAAESSHIPPEMLQQVLAAQEEDNGSGYTTADDALAGKLAGNAAQLAANEDDEQVYPPLPDTGDLKFPVEIQQELLAHPEFTVNSQEGREVHGGNLGGGLVGTVRNGRTSTWMTEALHNPASGAGTAVA
ncbi:hypothetical protein OEZ85_013493 [Tetradesmus obliquus]|nr:hypothetical protein OEZ85_013493 [Tetradesmus obliquus]WIA23831.1 hypothetical protein OEZ85_013493 [Tetradesmus obliquus]